MNLDKVFLAEVWYVVNWGYKSQYGSNYLKIYNTGKRLVYKSDLGFYRDLKTMKKYDSHCTGVTGSCYVNEEKELIPFKNLINEKKQDSTKRKVLFGHKKRTK